MNLHNTSPAVRTLALAAVAGALGLSACGGDESSDATTASIPTGQLSATELATEADSLCAGADERVAAQADVPDFGKNGLQSDEVKASTEFWEATAAEQADVLDQLSKLQPPADESKQWDQFLELYQSGRIDYSNDLAEPASQGDEEEFFNVALAAQRTLTQLDQTAKSLGMETCGASSLPAQS